jgi:hypothetical protein
LWWEHIVVGAHGRRNCLLDGSQKAKTEKLLGSHISFKGTPLVT